MIHGIDLSLTATGLATFDNNVLTSLRTFRPTEKVGMARIDQVATGVLKEIRKDDLVVIEGLAFMSQTPSALERTGLWYLVCHCLWRCEISYIVVPPTSLKKFATGKGNAKKEHMLMQVFRRWGVEASDDNQADAYSLGRLGLCYFRQKEPETQAQEEVLIKLGWKGKL